MACISTGGAGRGICTLRITAPFHRQRKRPQGSNACEWIIYTPSVSLRNRPFADQASASSSLDIEPMTQTRLVPVFVNTHRTSETTQRGRHAEVVGNNHIPTLPNPIRAMGEIHKNRTNHAFPTRSNPEPQCRMMIERRQKPKLRPPVQILHSAQNCSGTLATSPTAAGLPPRRSANHQSD